MSADRWERLSELFHSALALSGEEREGFLSRACAGDRELRAEVERLIAADARAGEFMDPLTTGAAAVLLGGGSASDHIVAGRRFGPYRVAREVGRGGMGAVYLAERADGAYEQRVAIKLIKRGMDTDLILERFRAERQILASLDHPNIARLIDAGTSEDGRPYFVMEYIEGEPIDEYADARRLTVGERLRLFLQVCGAVAYAHTRRVIHRDIKPVNILVTREGVPKLLDFGIAKALEPGAGEPTSSVTGLRLLTPEYASPEQVDGRHATTVSDVYSLGVVLYELLTGRSPYRPRSREPLDVVEAVRTTDPERPSTAVAHPTATEESGRRRERLMGDRAAATGSGSTDKLGRQLRGDLDMIVLTALRKEPDRRYRSVDEFADDIQRHLDGRPVRARPDGVRYRAGKFLRRNRVAVIAASLAAVTALLVGAAAVSLRTAGEPAEPSLVATGALAPRDRIIIAEFADRAGDRSLAAAVTEAFRVDLAQSPLVRVLTPNEVRAALARMQRSPSIVLDDTLAHELAVREGAKALVMGSVARVGGAYTVSVELINAETGEPLAAHRETATDSSRLIGAVDRASKALRLRMGESLRELRDMPSLEQVTTASLPALRKYTEGYRIFLAGGDRVRALRLYEEAVALDTGFASAHGAIASAYQSLAEPGRAAAAHRHVLANVHRLPFRDRQFVLGGDAYAGGNYQKAVEVYDRVLEREPNLVPALNNQALAYRDWRRFAAAESLWQRAIRGDSTIAVLYYGLHTTQVLQGKFDESRRTLDLIGRRFPSDPILMTVWVQDASARQAWDEAERRARENIAAKRGDTLQLVDAFESLGGIVMTQGRLAEAERHWRSQLTMSAASESWGRHLFGVQQLAYLQLRYRSAPEKARALLDSALARKPLDSILPGDRPYRDLAMFYARAGDLARARALAAAADSNDRLLGHDRPADRSWTLGVIALAEGRTREAESELRKAADTHFCPICPLPDLAKAYEAGNKPADAAATYDRYATTPWLWRYETDAVQLGWALLRLGELYEQRSSPELAAAAYSRLLHLWRRADRELVPVVADVRRRLDILDRAAPPR